MKYFLITVDTEEDNQWDTKHEPTTNNVDFLPRFQELCEKYNYIPTYFTTFGIAQNTKFVSYMKSKFGNNLCEIGMHMHAWDTPPFYNLAYSTDARPYITEYPIEIIDQKVGNITNLLEQTFEQKITSHRSGRWAINNDYIDILSKYNYMVDCSVTPLINWSKTLGATSSHGNDYSRNSIYPSVNSSGIIEVPMTIRNMHNMFLSNNSMKSMIKSLYKMCFGEKVWLRPGNEKNTVQKMKKLVDYVLKEDTTDYLMFMIHSSELMPGGSPNFTDSESIENLFKSITELFDYIKPNVEGCSVSDYATKIKKNDLFKFSAAHT